MSLRVAELRVYPVKSFAGSKLDSAVISPTGLPFDRHFVVATRSGNFLTQRQYPRMALARASISPSSVASGAVPPSEVPSEACLVLSAPGQGELRVPLCRPVSSDELRRVRVWGWEGLAVDQGEAAAAWVSEAVGAPDLRLLRFAAARDWSAAELLEGEVAVGSGGDAGALRHPLAQAERRAESPTSPLPAAPAPLSHLAPRREVDPLWSPPGTETAFSDGFPYLIATLASLESANAAVREATGGAGPALDIRRFRPNVVVEGARPWEEDEWERLRVGGALFDVNKPCARCVMTTVDPDAGTRPREGPKAEPLRTLQALRSGRALGWTGKSPADFDDGIFFGWNAAAVPLERGEEGDAGEGGREGESAAAPGGAEARSGAAAAALGVVRVGDEIDVLRRRGGAPLEGASADRAWRADARAGGECAFACADGACPIAAGLHKLWSLLARALAASGLSPYVVVAAVIAVGGFYAGFALAGNELGAGTRPA